MQWNSPAVAKDRTSPRPSAHKSNVRSLPFASTDQSANRMEIAISALRPADSPRFSGEDEEHICRLVETESVTPPIIVHRQTMRVVDGMHRLRAAILKGQKMITVEFFEGTEDDAFVRSVQINTSHGLPLTLAERRAAAARIVSTHPELSDRSVASCAGLNAKTIAAIRRSTGESPQLNARRGADGRVRPLDPNEGRRRAANVVTARPDASLREIAKEAGISLATAKDVRDRIRRGDAPFRQRDGRQAVGAIGEPTPRVSDHLNRISGHAAGRADVPAILSRLRRDPALRLSESGRDLLRILHMHASGLGEWSNLVKAAPPHCLDTLVVLANRFAEEWRVVESDIKQRQQSS